MRPRARLSHSFAFGVCVLVYVDTRVGERSTRSQDSSSLPFLSVCLLHVVFEHSVCCQIVMIDLGGHSIYSLQHDL